MQKCLEYKLKYRMIKTYLKVHLKCVGGGGGEKKKTPETWAVPTGNYDLDVV